MNQILKNKIEIKNPKKRTYNSDRLDASYASVAAAGSFLTGQVDQFGKPIDFKQLTTSKEEIQSKVDHFFYLADYDSDDEFSEKPTNAESQEK